MRSARLAQIKIVNKFKFLRSLIMSLEIILDILLSAIVLMVYRADCQQQPSFVYSCDSSEMSIFGHQEYAATRFVNPEDYESTVSHRVTDADRWVTDPMDDLPLDELFAAADAIVPVEPEVAAELQAIDEEIDLLLPVRTKVATVVQLRTIAKKLYSETPKGNKAELTERVLNAFANRGILQHIVGDLTFIRSDDDQSVLVLLK